MGHKPMRRVTEEQLSDALYGDEPQSQHEILYAILPEDGRPPERILFQCPRSKNGNRCGVPFLPKRLPNGAGWSFDGNVEAPTLTPSINCDSYCGWHGWITNGQLVGE